MTGGVSKGFFVAWGQLKAATFVKCDNKDTGLQRGLRWDCVGLAVCCLFLVSILLGLAGE